MTKSDRDELRKTCDPKMIPLLDYVDELENKTKKLEAAMARIHAIKRHIFDDEPLDPKALKRGDG